MILIASPLAIIVTAGLHVNDACCFDRAATMQSPTVLGSLLTRCIQRHVYSRVVCQQLGQLWEALQAAPFTTSSCSPSPWCLQLDQCSGSKQSVTALHQQSVAGSAPCDRRYSVRVSQHQHSRDWSADSRWHHPLRGFASQAAHDDLTDIDEADGDALVDTRRIQPTGDAVVQLVEQSAPVTTEQREKRPAQKRVYAWQQEVVLPIKAYFIGK